MLSAQIIGRGAGLSVVAAARLPRRLARLVEAASAGCVGGLPGSGAALDDEAHGAVHDFGRKRGVVHSEVVLPTDAPPWMADRERLWNAVEASERRKDAQLAREIQVAIPRELDRDSQIALVRDFVTEQFVARGMVADFAIHDVKARDGGRQPHSHVMLTMRRIDPESRTGFGLKETDWNRKELLIEWREVWAEHVNHALEQAAVAERVDHRTLEAQRQEAAAAGNFEKAAAFDREPEPKVGPQAWALERDGIHDRPRRPAARGAGAERPERRQVYAAGRGRTARRRMARFLALREQAGDALEAFVAWGEETRGGAGRRFARGAMVAAGIGAAALGLLPERDSFQPPEATVAVTAPVTPREEHAVSGEDADIMAILAEMDRESAGGEYSPADLADLARFEAMAQAERARVEAMGGEWTYPGYILANPDPEDRMHEARATEESFARADAAEEAAFYAEEPERVGGRRHGRGLAGAAG